MLLDLGIYERDIDRIIRVIMTILMMRRIKQRLTDNIAKLRY